MQQVAMRCASPEYRSEMPIPVQNVLQSELREAGERDLMFGDFPLHAWSGRPIVITSFSVWFH
jgi:hypothetical protein